MNNVVFDSHVLVALQALLFLIKTFAPIIIQFCSLTMQQQQQQQVIDLVKEERIQKCNTCMIKFEEAKQSCCQQFVNRMDIVGERSRDYVKQVNQMTVASQRR